VAIITPSFNKGTPILNGFSSMILLLGSLIRKILVRRPLEGRLAGLRVRRRLRMPICLFIKGRPNSIHPRIK
jgi:hypothetical protein